METDCGTFPATWNALVDGFLDWDYEDAEKRRQARADAEATANESIFQPPTEDVIMTAGVVEEWAEHNDSSASHDSEALFLQAVGFPRVEPQVVRPYSKVKLLVLDYNRLTSGCGLSQLHALECISLRFNRISSVDWLSDFSDPGRSKLAAVDLTRNSLRDLTGLRPLKSLQVLVLRENNIGPGLGCIQQLELCDSLAALDLSANRLTESGGAEAAFTAAGPNLHSLDLRGNDFCRAMRQYRRRFIAALPRLCSLDASPVSALERAASEAWVAGGTSAEVSVRKNFQDTSQASGQQPEQDPSHVKGWALPGSVCQICGCQHPPDKPKPKSKAKAEAPQAALRSDGGALGQGEKLSRWDLKSAGFEAGDEDLTVGWRKMPDFMKDIRAPAPKRRPAPSLEEDPELPKAQERCRQLEREGRDLSLRLMESRGAVSALGLRREELRSELAALAAEEAEVEQGLREGQAVRQLRGLSKSELGEVKSAGRSASAPPAMRTLLEAMYHMLTVQPGRPFRRVEQKEWARVQRLLQAEDLLDRVLDYSPERLLSSAQLMQHLAALGEEPKAAEASASRKSKRGSSTMSSGALGGAGYAAFHGWIKEVSLACRKLRDLRRSREDLGVELKEAEAESEELLAPCRQLAEGLGRVEAELREARQRLAQLRGENEANCADPGKFQVSIQIAFV